MYSSNYSRPNAPVNMLVGLLILKELNRSNDEELIASLYFDYRLIKEELEQRTAFLLKHSLLLYDIVPEHLKDTEAYLNLTSLLEEQTDHLSPKDSRVIQSSSMQNPHEPEANYRVKGKKSYVGYTTNLVEARDREKGLSMIVHYEKQPNITRQLSVFKDRHYS